MNKQEFMRTKPILPLLLSMGVPMMISMLIQSLYNIVDSIYVSRLGTDAITAISLVYPLQNVIMAVSVGVGVGIGSVISMNLGAGDQEKADRAASVGMFLTFIHVAVFILIGIFCYKAVSAVIYKGRTGAPMGVRLRIHCYDCFFWKSDPDLL